MQYLVLDDSVFARPDGHLYACCPQVKKPKDIERLWKGVNDGEVCVISTDTCTFTKAQKARWEGDWTKIPMGLPGLETLLPLVYTQGVLGKKIRLNRFVEKCCTNPAKIMGLYPRKGVLQAGSDADIAIIDPEKTHQPSIMRRWKAAPIGTPIKACRWPALRNTRSAGASRSWRTTNASAKKAGANGCRASGLDRYSRQSG